MHDTPRASTKGPRDESFPVASLVLARRHRAAILAFYRFVRAADDIADAASLAPDEKIRRLDAAEAALLGGDAAVPAAAALHAVDAAHGTGIAEARQLLAAFRQDAGKSRYADWQELADYCRLSANPVGRFLLGLHREGEEACGPSDALCTALQVLNHLQDLRRDREALDRIYLPVRWLDIAGGEAAFFAPRNGDLRRRVLDAALDRVDALIDVARALPCRVRDPRLRMQCAATVQGAARLSARLRRADPVLARVRISRADAAAAFLAGLCGGRRPEARGDERVARDAVHRSGSSFRLGMRSLAAERRRAIYAVYAFCRAVDDIADGAAPAADKRQALDAWRAELDRLRPETPVGRELARAARAFDLPRAECHALLDGMEADAAERLRLDDEPDLDAYTRRVAGSVGVLSIRIFGAPEAESFALGLGRTLQIVNILRDVDEDAAADRVYVPLSRLRRLGLEDGPARTLVADARFARACQALAAEARDGFAAADRALRDLDRSRLRPAILMMESYRRILDRLDARGWGVRQGRLRLTASDRLQLLTLAMRTA
jgi:hydroxysqualene synthase